MAQDNKRVTIFRMPLVFPCGPQSACCGPIGQSEEEIQDLKSSIGKELGCLVEVVNVLNGSEMKDHLLIVRLLRAFGPMALPIITLDSEVISIGNPTPGEAVSAIKEKMNQN